MVAELSKLAYFTPNPRCAKCMCVNMQVAYKHKDKTQFQDEHLLCKCDRCGYTFKMKTADHREPRAEHVDS